MEKPRINYSPGSKYPFQVVKQEEVFEGRLDWIVVEEFDDYFQAQAFLHRYLKR